MALTDVAVRSPKPRGKDYKLADSAGLYLLVTPSGGKLWRLKYRVHEVEKKLALGRYPEVSLSEARKARDTGRESASTGDDPSNQRRRERIAARIAVGTTFGDVAQEYIEKAQREGRAEATLVKLRWMREWLLPAVGHRHRAQLAAGGPHAHPYESALAVLGQRRPRVPPGAQHRPKVPPRAGAVLLLPLPGTPGASCRDGGLLAP